MIGKELERNRGQDWRNEIGTFGNANHIVREVGDLVRRANEAGKRLATLSVDTEVRFRSPTDRAAFTHELTEAIAKLVSKYHDESAPGGRAHRLVIVAHPLPQKSQPKEQS